MDKFEDLVPEERAAGVSKDDTCIHAPRRMLRAARAPLAATRPPRRRAAWWTRVFV